jgi:fatty-acid desaturase
MNERNGHAMVVSSARAPPPARRRDPVDEALAQSASTFRSPRMFDANDTGAVEGEVRWQPVKSLWISGMTAAALIGGPLCFTWDAFFLFLVTTAPTLCLGHSLGTHRRLIHRAFDCPLWLERLFVYLGTLVGMAGPYGMIRQHDIRDWAQRKPQCHAYLAHRSGIVRDAFWQLHCELVLAHPPRLIMERRVAQDRFYQLIERTWMVQQLPWAGLFLILGGLPWLVWGIAVRVAISVTGHWLVGYFAHNRGPRSWHIEGAGVQGYNVRYCGLITMGEAWHNNHHAFPASARLGLRPGETDPGWWVLVLLSRLGLVWNLKTPDTLPPRPNLVALINDAAIPGCSARTGWAKARAPLLFLRGQLIARAVPTRSKARSGTRGHGADAVKPCADCVDLSALRAFAHPMDQTERK